MSESVSRAAGNRRDSWIIIASHEVNEMSDGCHGWRADVFVTIFYHSRCMVLYVLLHTK